MIENLVFHDKSKHIEIKYFYIMDMVQKGAIKLHYVSTDEQVAMFSASAMLRETLDCFLFSHELMVDPIQYHPPEVLFLSTTLPTQSESVYPYNL